VGVLTVANHGRREELKMEGVPVGREISEPPPVDNRFGSAISIVATDAPMSPRQLNHLAKRAGSGLIQVGGMVDPEESCIVISFSTGIRLKSRENPIEYHLSFLADHEAFALHRAASEAAQESVLNALFKATTLTGRDGHVSEAVPIDRVRKVMKEYGRIMDE
jgi:D-aminopeptidase